MNAASAVVNLTVVVVGLVADVDIESERLRWMGALRLDVYVCDSSILSRHSTV